MTLWDLLPSRRYLGILLCAFPGYLAFLSYIDHHQPAWWKYAIDIALYLGGAELAG